MPGPTSTFILGRSQDMRFGTLMFGCRRVTFLLEKDYVCLLNHYPDALWYYPGLFFILFLILMEIISFFTDGDSVLVHVRKDEIVLYTWRHIGVQDVLFLSIWITLLSRSGVLWIPWKFRLGIVLLLLIIFLPFKGDRKHGFYFVRCKFRSIGPREEKNYT